MVDAEAIVDINEYARMTSCRFLWEINQFVMSSLRLALAPCAWVFCNFVGCCLCRKRKRVRINTTGTRELSPESESEPDEAERPCQAVRIGVMGDKGMRPLAPQGCGDEAQAQDTTILFEGADVSDIGPPVDGENPHVSMCAHHHQLYLATLPSRKCSQITCYHRAQSAKDGVPLCRKHLGILGEEANPVLGVFSGLRYRFGRRRPNSRCRGQGVKNNFSSPPPEGRSSAAEATPASRPGLASANHPGAAKARPKSAGAARAKPALLAGWRGLRERAAPSKWKDHPVLVRLKLRMGTRKPPSWSLFLDVIGDEAADSRPGDTRCTVTIESPGLTCTVLQDRITGPPEPMPDGQIPENFLEELLTIQDHPATTRSAPTRTCRSSRRASSRHQTAGTAAVSVRTARLWESNWSAGSSGNLTSCSSPTPGATPRSPSGPPPRAPLRRTWASISTSFPRGRAHRWTPPRLWRRTRSTPMSSGRSTGRRSGPGRTTRRPDAAPRPHLVRRQLRSSRAPSCPATLRFQ